MDPMSYKDALGFITNKVNHPEWSAEQWMRQEPDVRSRAFFSANVENARFLNRAHQHLADFMQESRETVTLEDGSESTKLKIGSREDFVLRMREMMMKEGMLDQAELDHIKENTDLDVRELGSRARLGLIFDTNVRSAWGYGHWKQGMRPSILKRFPAARFVRVRGAKEPRLRHIQAEGDIKLKTDNGYWAKLQNGEDIGGFEVPWAPYGFNSYMQQEDVSKREAKKAGLNVDNLEPSKQGLNDNLKAGTKTLDPEIKKKLLEKLKQEQTKRRPSAAERAKEAAKKARLAAIERSLADAQYKGDLEAIRRAQRALANERAKQGLDTPSPLNIHATKDAIKVMPEYYTPPELESLEDFKKRLLEAQGTHGPHLADLAATSKHYKDRLDRLETLQPSRLDPEKYNRWVRAYNGTLEKWRAADKKKSTAGVDLVALPEHLQGQVKVLGKRPARGVKADGLDLFERVVHKDISEATIIKFLRKPYRRRKKERVSSLHYDFTTHGEVYIAPKAPPAVVAHEVMHQTEARYFLQESRDFLAKRANGEKAQTLNKLTNSQRFNPDEVAFEDHFAARGSSHYAGKLYGDSAEQARATELLTTGIERLLENPIEFMMQDADYFDWIIKLIQKRL